MIKKLMVCIFFYFSYSLVASDQKNIILSDNDHAFLKKAFNLSIDTISNNDQPLYLTIAALDCNLSFAAESKSLDHVLNIMESAKNILKYLRHNNRIFWPPLAKDQIDFCQVVCNTGFCAKWLIKNDLGNRPESRFFFHMIPYGVDIESFSSTKENNIFPSLCEQFSDHPKIINKFLYHYKPLLNSDTTTKQSCLTMILNRLHHIEQKRIDKVPFIESVLTTAEDEKHSNNRSLEIDFKDIMTPHFYQIYSDRVVRHDYKNIIQSKNSIKTFLLALNVFKREKQLVWLNKGVTNNCILPYILEMPIDDYKNRDSFLSYCRYAEKEFIEQYDNILKKSPSLLPPFIETKEKFIKLLEEVKK